MPVIKSAIKKLRRDTKKTLENNAFRNQLDRAIKTAKKQKTGAAVRDAVSLVDRSVKKNLMHKNRAARIKSNLSKLSKPFAKKAIKAVIKKTVKKNIVKRASKTKK